MKQILLGSIFVILGISANAELLPSIPEATLQIAKEAEIISAFDLPKSEIIKVGIGDNDFKSYDYSNSEFFATGEMKVLSNNAEIATIPANKILKINLIDDKFELSTEEVINRLSDPIKITCKDGLIGINGLKRGGSQALYRGEIELIKSKSGKFHIVNIIEIEEYLKGVVPNEMPVRFGLEALKAQSVSARNYALSPRTKAYEAFDVVDSVASQVYFGANTEKELGTRAVEETEGIVALYNWNLILAQYCSTAGGYTESFANAFSDPKTKMFPSVSKPYLIAKPDMIGQKPLNLEEEASKFYKNKPDSYDMKSPYFRWERTWSKHELQQALQENLPIQSLTGFISPHFNKGDKLDEIVDIKVKRRGESGKIIELEIVTKTQNITVYKELVIRRLFKNSGKALPSANLVFELQKDDDGNIVSVNAFGGGYGHGVGMSQYGAGFMASELNFTYDKILRHYYTDIVLGTKPVILSATNNVIRQNFYTNNKKVNLIIDNKYKLSYFLVNINGKEKQINLSKNFISRIEKIDISNELQKGKNTIIFYYPLDEDKDKGIRLFVELENEYNN